MVSRPSNPQSSSILPAEVLGDHCKDTIGGPADRGKLGYLYTSSLQSQVKGTDF